MESGSLDAAASSATPEQPCFVQEGTEAQRRELSHCFQREKSCSLGDVLPIHWTGLPETLLSVREAPNPGLEET